MDPVVHFEMPYTDKQRMAGFYSKAFGWQTRMLGPEMGSYVVVTTTESGADGRPTRSGAINGGFFERPKDAAGQHPSVVIAVTDLQDALKKVKAAGGTLLKEPMDIPGIGLYAGFLDSEGNRVSLLQPSM